MQYYAAGLQLAVGVFGASLFPIVSDKIIFSAQFIPKHSIIASF